MLEQDLVARVKFSLSEPPGARSLEETLAAEELCRVCEPVIRARIWRVLDARNEIDDLVQDVWVLVIRRLPTWELDPTLGAFQAWVGAIASREAWRRARNRSKHLEQPLDLELVGEILVPELDSLSELEREEWQEAARSVLADLEAKLSPLSARIFRMRYFDGKSIPEIAADVGHSVDCVKMRLRRARHLLEQDLRHRESGRP